MFLNKDCHHFILNIYLTLFKYTYNYTFVRPHNSDNILLKWNTFKMYVFRSNPYFHSDFNFGYICFLFSFVPLCIWKVFKKSVCFCGNKHKVPIFVSNLIYWHKLGKAGYCSAWSRSKTKALNQSRMLNSLWTTHHHPPSTTYRIRRVLGFVWGQDFVCRLHIDQRAITPNFAPYLKIFDPLLNFFGPIRFWSKQVGPTPESNSILKCILGPKRFWIQSNFGFQKDFGSLTWPVMT